MNIENNENAPIRILQFVGNMDAGGMETFLMNMYRKIDRSAFQFDFVVHYKKKGVYEDEIHQLGGNIYCLPLLEEKNPIRYSRKLKQLFREHPEYKIVHGHHSALGFLYLKIAKECDIPIRIAHSHNSEYTRTVRGLVTHLFEKFYPYNANWYLACSYNSGVFMFGHKRRFTVVKNGIDVEKFRFRDTIRNQKRKELNIENKFVIGHVGRFQTQKNHKFLIKVFKEIHKRMSDAVLVLVGDGELRNQIENEIRNYNLEKYVILTGVRTDVNELVQAFDVFLFPSLYEGLPLTLVEAQISGLPIVCSSVITDECKMIPEYYTLGLNENISEWVHVVMKLTLITHDRSVSYKNIINAGFDSESCVRELESLYKSMIANLR